MSSPPQSHLFLRGVVAFAVLLGLALFVFAGASWLEGVAVPWWRDPAAWLSALDREAARDSISSAAEVVAGVLSIAITVVAIVVELAATRFTHKVTELFVRDPVNIVVMGFFVLTTILCVWVAATPVDAGGLGAETPHAAVGVAIVLVTLCLLLLLPYFAYVLAFLSPGNVIRRIRAQAARAISRARAQDPDPARLLVMGAVEELEDIARGAVSQGDRGIAMDCVNALDELLREYGKMHGELPASWFEVNETLTRDPDFVSMDPFVLAQIGESRLWLEVKILRQYHALFGDCLGQARDVANLIALNTRRIAVGAASSNLRLLDLCVRFFNSYLRAAINARDLRASYYLLDHYRSVAQDALALGLVSEGLGVADHLVYYGRLGHAMGQSFLLEVVAYDLAALAEFAATRERGFTDELLDRVLQVDQEGDAPHQEDSLRGVRRSQVQLAAFFLARGDEARARRIFRDMDRERPARLAALQDELMATRDPRYREFTDRGIDFAYVPPERLAALEQFFGWFGDRLQGPPRPMAAEGAGPAGAAEKP